MNGEFRSGGNRTMGCGWASGCHPRMAAAHMQVGARVVERGDTGFGGYLHTCKNYGMMIFTWAVIRHFLIY